MIIQVHLARGLKLSIYLMKLKSSLSLSLFLLTYVGVNIRSSNCGEEGTKRKLLSHFHKEDGAVRTPWRREHRWEVIHIHDGDDEAPMTHLMGEGFNNHQHHHSHYPKTHTPIYEPLILENIRTNTYTLWKPI